MLLSREPRGLTDELQDRIDRNDDCTWDHRSDRAEWGSERSRIDDGRSGGQLRQSGNGANSDEWIKRERKWNIDLRWPR